MQKYVIFVKSSLKLNILKIKSFVKLEIIAIIQVNTEVNKEITIIDHNGINYDYHFIIKNQQKNFKNNLLV